jgi:hypothetical protein
VEHKKKLDKVRTRRRTSGKQKINKGEKMAVGKCVSRWRFLVKILVCIAIGLITLRLCLELSTNVKPVAMRVAGFYKTPEKAWAHCWFSPLVGEKREQVQEPERDATGQAKHAIELDKLRQEVRDALGQEARQRTQKEISEFLAAFNASKAERDLSDQDLTQVIMAQIKPWGLWSKWKFKCLVDAYKRAHPSKKLS